MLTKSVPYSHDDGSCYWKLIPFNGIMSHVSASGRGYLWGVAEQEQIFKCVRGLCTPIC